jgi:hypothetical protein
MSETDDDELYESLFSPQQPPPLTDERQQLWDALFGEEQGKPLSDEQQQLYDSLFSDQQSGVGLTVDEAGDYLELFGDESVMAEPAVIETLEGVAGAASPPPSSTVAVTARSGEPAEQALEPGAPQAPAPASDLPAWLYPGGLAPQVSAGEA